MTALGYLKVDKDRDVPWKAPGRRAPVEVFRIPSSAPSRCYHTLSAETAIFSRLSVVTLIEGDVPIFDMTLEDMPNEENTVLFQLRRGTDISGELVWSRTITFQKTQEPQSWLVNTGWEVDATQSYTIWGRMESEPSTFKLTTNYFEGTIGIGISSIFPSVILTQPQIRATRFNQTNQGQVRLIADDGIPVFDVPVTMIISQPGAVTRTKTIIVPLISFSTVITIDLDEPFISSGEGDISCQLGVTTPGYPTIKVVIIPPFNFPSARFNYRARYYDISADPYGGVMAGRLVSEDLPGGAMRIDIQQLVDEGIDDLLGCYGADPAISFPDLGTHTFILLDKLEGIVSGSTFDIIEPLATIDQVDSLQTALEDAISSLNDLSEAEVQAIIDSQTTSLEALINGLNDLSPLEVSEAVWNVLMADYELPNTTGRFLSLAGTGTVDYEVLAAAVWDRLLSGTSAEDRLVDAQTSSGSALGLLESATIGLAAAMAQREAISELLEDSGYGLEAAEAQRASIEAAIAGLNDLSEAEVQALLDALNNLSAEEVWSYVISVATAGERLLSIDSLLQAPGYGLVPAQTDRQQIKDLINGLENLSEAQVSALLDALEATITGEIGDLSTQLGETESNIQGWIDALENLSAAQVWGYDLDGKTAGERLIEVQEIAILEDIYEDTQNLLLQLGTASPIADLDSIWKILEASYTKIVSFVGGGLGERLTTESGFYDQEDIFHPNGSGPVHDGDKPLDDVMVLAYIETQTGPNAGRWRTLSARTYTNLWGEWAMNLDDALYILHFYRAGRVDAWEWRAISADGSLIPPEEDPRRFL